MKLIKKCPVFIALVLSWVVFGLMGILGGNTIYAKYKEDFIKTPYPALVMSGMGDGLFPWDSPLYGQMQQVSVALQEQLGRDVEGILRKSGNGSEKTKATSKKRLHEILGIAPKGEAFSEEGEAKTGEETVAVEESAGAVPGSENVVANNKEIVVPVDVIYEYETVPETYFNDALFIGDSRTVGMSEYGAMPESTEFFSRTSLTIYQALSKPIVQVDGAQKITVEEALQQKQYGKIYIMLGVNELGTGNAESFAVEYRKVLDRIAQLQPEAIIFIQSIMNVTGEKSAGDPIFNNINIASRNEEIAKFADNKRFFYIDVNAVVADENGDLNAEYTGDGIHLKAAYYQLWKQLLLESGIQKKE